MVRDHGDEGDRKEAPLAGPCLEVSLHPVLVLSLLIDDDNDVILLECQLVLVVRCAVVQGSASPSAAGVLQFDETKSVKYKIKNCHSSAAKALIMLTNYVPRLDLV